MECLWEDELLEDNDGSVPGRPQYGQHHLHRLKPLLIQLPQQQNPFILCNEYLLISRAFENTTAPSDKETAFHYTSLSWRQMRVNRTLSVGPSG